MPNPYLGHLIRVVSVDGPGIVNVPWSNFTWDNMPVAFIQRYVKYQFVYLFPVGLSAGILDDLPDEPHVILQNGNRMLFSPVSQTAFRTLKNPDTNLPYTRYETWPLSGHFVDVSYDANVPSMFFIATTINDLFTGYRLNGTTVLDDLGNVFANNVQVIMPTRAEHTESYDIYSGSNLIEQHYWGGGEFDTVLQTEFTMTHSATGQMAQYEMYQVQSISGNWRTFYRKSS